LNVLDVEDRLDKLTIKLERRLESKVRILKDREKRKKDRGEERCYGKTYSNFLIIHQEMNQNSVRNKSLKAKIIEE